MKARRCLWAVVAHKRDGMVNGTEQCKKPAVNGLRCEDHKDVVLEVWMEIPE